MLRIIFQCGKTFSDMNVKSDSKTSKEDGDCICMRGFCDGSIETNFRGSNTGKIARSKIYVEREALLVRKASSVFPEVPHHLTT